MEINYKRFLKQVGLFILLMLGGTAIDWVVHHLRDEWMVPTEYYYNKILYGAIWGLISFYALKYWWVVTDSKKMALLVPVFIAAVLQTKYYYQGWDLLSFVLLFMVLHYLMFLPFSWYIFRKYRTVFFEDGMPPVIPHRKLRRVGFVAAILLLEFAAWLYFTQNAGF